MALVLKDRVRVTSSTTGTGTFTLGSAFAGYQDFSVIGDGNTTYYAIQNSGDNTWEVGIGTYTSSGTTLSRDTILESSNGGTAVNFTAGTKDVFVTYPAEKGIYLDASGNSIGLGTPASATLTNATGLPIATGVSGLGSGIATFLTTPSSANLATTVTDETGSGSLVFATSPTLTTPVLGTPSSGTLTSCTGLPISTGVSGLGTNVATALAVNVGSSGAFVTNGGALGTPSSGTVTNLTGTASININGTVGATTPTTGAFTTLSSSGATTFTAGTASTSTTTGTAVITGGLGVSGRINADNFDGIVGANTAAAGSFTTLSATGVTTVQAGTALLPAITTSGDTNTGIWFPAADTIAASTGGSERMRIDTSGNVGIGLNNGTAKFTVAGTSSSNSGSAATYLGTIQLNENSLTTLQATGGIEFKGSVFGDGYGSKITGADDGQLLIGNRANSATWTERMRINQSGEVYIAGTTDRGAFNLQCNGTGVWGAGAYTNGSDERIKENITPLDTGLDVVAKLNPVTYKYKEEWSRDQSIQTGFIAQDLIVALEGKNYVDGIVNQSSEYMSVAYQNIIPILTKAIQEMKVIIDEQSARIAVLEAK